MAAAKLDDLATKAAAFDAAVTTASTDPDGFKAARRDLRVSLAVATDAPEAAGADRLALALRGLTPAHFGPGADLRIAAVLILRALQQLG